MTDAAFDPRQRGMRVRPLIASTRFREFLFLASHGLRNPLTAINWSYGRLQKLGDHSEQEQYYLDHIHRNVLRLSRMLSGLFLLARMDAADHRMNAQEFPVRPMLLRALPMELRGASCHIDCDEALTMRSDAEVCHVLFSSLLAACEAARRDPTSPLTVQVHGSATELSVRCTLRAHLEYLNSPEATHPGEKIVGGTPGLLFAMARELTAVLGGEFFCLLEDEEVAPDQAGDLYAVTVVFPLVAPDSSAA